MQKSVQLTLLGVFAAAGATLAVCLATTDDALNVARSFEPWSEPSQGVGSDLALPNAPPTPVERPPQNDPPVPDKIAEWEPYQEMPGPLCPPDAARIPSHSSEVRTLGRYEYVLVRAGHWLGQRHQAVYAMGHTQIAQIAISLARMGPHADEANTQLAAGTPGGVGKSATPPARATDTPAESGLSRPSEPRQLDVPRSFTDAQPKLAWVADVRRVRVRPRPAMRVGLSVTTDGVDAQTDSAVTRPPYVPAHGTPADRQVAEEGTDTSQR